MVAGSAVAKWLARGRNEAGLFMVNTGLPSIGVQIGLSAAFDAAWGTGRGGTVPVSGAGVVVGAVVLLIARGL